MVAGLPCGVTAATIDTLIAAGGKAGVKGFDPDPHAVTGDDERIEYLDNLQAAGLEGTKAVLRELIAEMTP